MSHRKFSAPRRGSLGFLPRGRSRHIRGRIRSWPKDDQSQAPKLQAFIGFKAGMTHVVREVVRAGSRLNKKEAVEAVTLIETPPMVVIGIIGYKETPQGLKPITTAWASFVGNEVKRCFYKNFYQSKKKAFAHLADSKDKMEERINKIRKEATVVRVIAHTQPTAIKLGSRKAEIIEIQINGGDVAAKVDFAKSLLEKNVKVSDVFSEGEQIDCIAVGKGRGWEGVIHRYGAKRLQKKTHRGRRKVACIGPFIPRRILWTVARAGNNGFHHRTEMNKRIYRITPAPEAGQPDETGSTQFDLTKKSINPMGGFVRYGKITNDFLMIKGSVTGCTKRAITLRKTININTRRVATEDINLKWIDTSSKFGHGRFQTKEERNKFLGKLKISKAENKA